MSNNCYNCNKRHVGCHSSCLKYAKFKEEKEKEKRIKENFKLEYTNAHIKANIKFNNKAGLITATKRFSQC